MDCIGINYEAGKIIEHIVKFDNCVGYANIQVAMDAPYGGRVADKTVRNQGRSEIQYTKYGYNESMLIGNLCVIFEYIKQTYHGVKIVLQIARGRSAESTFDEIFDRVFHIVGISNFETRFGYRSTDYYVPSIIDKFVFVNYGMFAVLTNVDKIAVGKICNPVTSFSLISHDETHGFIIDKSVKKFDTDVKNILSKINIFPAITLFGLSDHMAFVTPDTYKERHVMNLIDFV